MPDPLFSPLPLGDIVLPNRIVMSPLTRSRASRDGTPTDIMAEYYRQRASAGLIIAEATNISRQGTGYPYTPGIYTREMIEKWKDITRGVHQEGGRIYMQLWHVGRHSHPWYQVAGDPPVSASDVKENGSIKTPEGIKKPVTPRALDKEGIREIVNDFAQAAENAIEAGCDGVEIHGANGYLIDQFLQDGTNRRTDEYGGSIENRSRFLFEVLEAVGTKIGFGKTGLRLSPSGIKLDMSDSDPVMTFGYVVDKLNDFPMAYLHIVEPLVDVGHLPHYLKKVTGHFRKIYQGVLMTNGGFDRGSGNKIIEDVLADLVAYGKAYISNPDLVEKFLSRSAQTPWDTKTFYTQGEEGYLDYD